MRVPPRRRKYSANCGFVVQNPVSGKQLAWASVGVPGGARAATMLTRTNAVNSTTRLITLLTHLWTTVWSTSQRQRRASARRVPGRPHVRVRDGRLPDPVCCADDITTVRGGRTGRGAL